MNISPGTVRSVLSNAVSADSFTAGLVTSVTEDFTVPTACISADGRMRYNGDFVDKNVKSQSDLFCLVFHEVLHVAFSHIIHGGGELANIGCDAIINAIISCTYPNASNHGALFAKLYTPHGVEGLLRPDSRMDGSSFEGLYGMLYCEYGSRDKFTAAGVIDTLRILLAEKKTSCLLLGAHGEGVSEEGVSGEAYGPEAAGKIAEDIKNELDSKGQSAGYVTGLTGMFIDLLKHHKTLKRRLLDSYAVRKKVGGFMQSYRDKRRITSPVPVSPSRRDVVLMAAGVWPGVFRNEAVLHRERRSKGLAIFLDVSGSVNRHLPDILSVVSNSSASDNTVYLFSNKVVEVTMTQLRNGKLSTTHGTDFDCIAEKILEERFKKAVIITDGIAGMQDDNKEKLRRARLETLTIIFGDQSLFHQRSIAFKEFGEVIALEDAIEQT